MSDIDDPQYTGDGSESPKITRSQRAEKRSREKEQSELAVLSAKDIIAVKKNKTKSEDSLPVKAFKGRAKSSLVWKYFKKLPKSDDRQYVQCEKCDTKIVFYSSTTSMSKHTKAFRVLEGR